MRLPDEALVVRGGLNLPGSFANASGAAIDVSGKVQSVSVNSAAGLTVAELTVGDPATGYPGIPHKQIGVTTVGAIRAAGGDVAPSASKANPHHARLGGLTPEKASELFRPTVPNPSRRKP